MNAATLEKPSTELTLIQRAVIALGDNANEIRLRTLAAASAGILAVTNADGRAEAHRAGMVLAKTRTAITSTGKTAREDATAFSKAVIAMEKDLIAIIQPEETRVLALRDGFDAEEQARKDAAIAAERARTDAIKVKIAGFKQPAAVMFMLSGEIYALITELRAKAPGDEFEEFISEAKEVHAESESMLLQLMSAAEAREIEAWEAKQAAEAETARLIAERLADGKRRAAEAWQLAKDREELAELQRAAREVAAEQKRAADALAAQVAAEQVETARILAERNAQFQREKDAHAAEVKRQAAEIAAQQAAADARDAQAVIDAVHIEALEMNAYRDEIMAKIMTDAIEMNAAHDAETARLFALLPVVQIETRTETADDQAIRCHATVVAALSDAADEMPDQLHIDIEAVQWAYYRLYSLRVAVESIESAMMMDRLNLMMASV